MARIHRKARVVLQSGRIAEHGNYRARKAQPASSALGIRSAVAKRTSKVRQAPRRSGKWSAIHINTRLTYQGLDEAGRPVWA